MIRRPPRSPLFPSPPLFRSGPAEPLELPSQPLVVGAEDRLHVLGIERLGSRREADEVGEEDRHDLSLLDRKSTRLNSSHLVISYAVFCLKKKTRQHSCCLQC